LRNGENLVNLTFFNVGNFLARNCKHADALYVVPKPTEENAIFNDFLKQNSMIDCGDITPASGTLRQYVTHTLKTTLSATEVADIETSHGKQICATARVVWADASGRYQKDFCECWSGPYASQTSWASCGVHNSELKLH
jgi:hypothetical protein